MSKSERVEVAEFIGRFMQHVLPARYVKIRNYGFLSNSMRKDLLPRCRELLEKLAPKQSFLLRRAVDDEMLRFVDRTQQRVRPVCGEGFVRIV
ncbi:MAG: transposase [Fibrobacterota bacterium]